MENVNLPNFINSELIAFLKNISNDKNVKIVTCEVDKNLKDISLSGKLRGGREDDFYVDNDYHRMNVRRGGSFYEFNKTPIIARKGLPKFFYLKYSHIDANAKTDNWNNKKSRKKKKKNSEKNIKSIILEEVEAEFKENHKVKISLLEKANGENCQISYISQIDHWVIASKNVSLIAKSRADLEKYKENTRFNFAYLIGVTFFEILESRNISQKNLKDDIKNMTLVGEYCGNPQHVHLIDYKNSDIRFYAIVEHNSLNPCILPDLANLFFKKHSFTSVSIKNIGEFDNFHDFQQSLRFLYESVQKSTIEEAGEGNVLYFSTKDRVLNLCKLKTLEYSIFRKLREKLKRLNSEKFNAYFKKDKMEFLMKEFKSECSSLCLDFDPPKPRQYYFEVANKCFLEVLANNITNLQDRYLELLNKVRKTVKIEDFEENKIFCNSEEQEEEKKSEENDCEEQQQLIISPNLSSLYEETEKNHFANKNDEETKEENLVPKDKKNENSEENNSASQNQPVKKQKKKKKNKKKNKK